jgi:hypothetical protein
MNYIKTLRVVSKIRKRCQVVLCGNDYERIKHALTTFKSNVVYLIENENPIPTHAAHDEEVARRLVKILKGMQFSDDEIKRCEVNYYKFDEALVSLYELFLTLQDDYEIILNVTGGTKLLAVASVIAAMFTNVEPIYIAAKEYSGDLDAPGKGFIDQPIGISPLFELSNILLPTGEEEITILKYLLAHQNEGAKTVAEMIPPSEIAEIHSRVGAAGTGLPQKELKKVVSKYSHYASKLQKQNLVEEGKHHLILTGLGNLVARLVVTRDRVKSRTKSK